MSNIDYEELIRSPLDDLEPTGRPRWWLLIVGAFVGVLVGWVLVIALRGGESDSAVVSVVSTTVVADVIAPEFPDGYVELAPGLGAQIGELILQDDKITMSVSTLVARGGDVLAPQWPVGGTWWLESATGVVVEDQRVVLGRFSPGVFSVEFPAAPFRGESQFARVSLAERWDQHAMAGSVTLPFTGEPFVAGEPITIPVSQDVTLIVANLELGRYLGKVEWDLQGPENGGRVEIAALLLDEEGVEIGSYSALPILLDPRDHGINEILWGQPRAVDQATAVTVRLDYTVYVAEITPDNISFSLAGVPIGR